jgi:hypothetical protein
MPSMLKRSGLDSNPDRSHPRHMAPRLDWCPQSQNGLAGEHSSSEGTIPDKAALFVLFNDEGALPIPNGNTRSAGRSTA